MTELNDCITALLKVQRNIIEELDDKIKIVEKHHRDCNISNSVGAGAGVIGTAALIAAPFTGGLSLIVGGVGGVAMGTMAVDAVTNIATSIVDGFMSHGFSKEINELLKTQEDAANKLQALLDDLQSVVTAYKDENGCTEEQAWDKVLNACLSAGGKDLMTAISATSGAITAVKATKFAKDVATMERAGCSIGVSILPHIPAGALDRVSSQIGTVINIMALVKNVVQLGFMIYRWTKKCPTLNEIEEFLHKLKESNSYLEELLRAIN